MSGGIAYVLDEDGDLRAALQPGDGRTGADRRTRTRPWSTSHHQGGDLERTAWSTSVHDMTRFDAIRLKQLITNHLHYTGSAVARRILDDWDNLLARSSSRSCRSTTAAPWNEMQSSRLEPAAKRRASRIPR
jgi:glutamate synthase (NADPH/NADH) large chain